MNFEKWNAILKQKVTKLCQEQNADAAHDLLHFERVVKTAIQLTKQENAKIEVVLPAAWLHDFVIVPKSDPRRSQASRLSGEAAKKWLQEVQYPYLELLPDIAHAIEAHSFSANIPAETLEAKVVQDADRLDGIGAIGIARCFAVAGSLNRPFYDEAEPFAQSRTLDDKANTLDHFYVKLFKTVDTMQTNAGKKEAAHRANTMRAYLEELKREI